jgi:hypothetical protein
MATPIKTIVIKLKRKINITTMQLTYQHKLINSTNSLLIETSNK